MGRESDVEYLVTSRKGWLSLAPDQRRSIPDRSRSGCVTAKALRMKEFEVTTSGGRSAGPGHGGVEEHLERADYLQKRQLKSGGAGWVLLAGFGVSYVVSGDYSGWNFGLAQGGFGGLAIAAVVIAGMYLALVLGMAELSSALPASTVVTAWWPIPPTSSSPCSPKPTAN